MSTTIDLSLYLVSHRNSLSVKDFFKIISESIAGGVTLVQLREKQMRKEELIALGKDLKDLLKAHLIPLIINDDIDIAYALQADGVHLGQTDRSATEARAVLGPEAIIGLSVETLQQLYLANNQPINYVAASAVFESKTKENCSTCWGVEGLKQVCRESVHPVVAIGGIAESNMVPVVEAGIQGIAVSSALFLATCPKQTAANMRKIIEKHKRT